MARGILNDQICFWPIPPPAPTLPPATPASAPLHPLPAARTLRVSAKANLFTSDSDIGTVCRIIGVGCCFQNSRVVNDLISPLFIAKTLTPSCNTPELSQGPKYRDN